MYFCIVFASVTQSATTKLFNRSCPHSAVFNAVKSLSALLLFLVLSFFGFDFHLPTLLYGLSYGACPTITAAFTSSFFGMKHFSTNMALMTFTVMGGSLIATVSNKVLEATGGYNGTFLMLLGLTFVALILNLFIRKP